MPRLQPASHAEAMDRRAREALESAMADEEFMSATREGIEEIRRGVPGVSLRDVQAAERVQRGG